jgi:hypothetical protein
MNIAVQTRESRETAANTSEVELIASRENHPVAYTLKPEPIEIDPRPCVCGYMIDRHLRVDTPEGPEFYCQDIEADELAYSLVRDWEAADLRDRWRYAGEAPPPVSVRNSDITARSESRPRSYEPATSTIDTFWFLVALAEPQRLKTWLADRPKDAAFLLRLLEAD